MKWNASVSMTLTLDYENIEVETEEEATQIAEDMAREDISYNNAEERAVSAYVWESED